MLRYRKGIEHEAEHEICCLSQISIRSAEFTVFFILYYLSKLYNKAASCDDVTCLETKC